MPTFGNAAPVVEPQQVAPEPPPIEGMVEGVKVLRSAGIFDQPAVDAVKQWRYSPVILNGHPEKFILTVVVTFTLQ